MIEHEVWMNADRETVFDAITTREGLDGWWGPVLTAEPKVGFVVEFDHGAGAPMRMRITDLVPSQQVAWKCVSDFNDANNPGSEWLGQHFSFQLGSGEEDPAFDGWLGTRLDLDATRGVTILRFRNTGWPEDARWRAFCNTAWGETLGVLLKNACEGRRPSG